LRSQARRCRKSSRCKFHRQGSIANNDNIAIEQRLWRLRRQPLPIELRSIAAANVDEEIFSPLGHHLEMPP
jgi:hypothetical protein